MVPLAFYYVRWHYTQGLIDYVRNWGNFYWFIWNFFSVVLLLNTLFDPFHRLDEGYKKGFDLGAWAESFIVNMLMRVVGIAVRITFIAIALILLVVVTIGGAVVLMVWLSAPLFTLSLITIGLSLLMLG